MNISDMERLNELLSKSSDLSVLMSIRLAKWSSKHNLSEAADKELAKIIAWYTKEITK